MSKSQITAIVLGVLLTAVVFMAAGIALGVHVMQHDAVKYGHAEWSFFEGGKMYYQWRWKGEK